MVLRCSRCWHCGLNNWKPNDTWLQLWNGDVTMITIKVEGFLTMGTNMVYLKLRKWSIFYNSKDFYVDSMGIECGLIMGIYDICDQPWLIHGYVFHIHLSGDDVQHSPSNWSIFQQGCARNLAKYTEGYSVIQKFYMSWSFLFESRGITILSPYGLVWK